MPQFVGGGFGEVSRKNIKWTGGFYLHSQTASKDTYSHLTDSIEAISVDHLDKLLE